VSVHQASAEKGVKVKNVTPRTTLVAGILLATAVAATCYPGARASSVPSGFETRCGWFSNPTPANIWFYDRDGEWTIGVQGGYQVEGDWPWPHFKRGQWVKTNNDYGYGCVCMQMRVNKETREVLEIKSSRARPLASCRKDRSLKRWAGRLD
jgi:hypothetical protein